MARVDLFAKIPLIGMTLVFLAMAIVAVTAYLHAGWYSIIGYAIAAAVYTTPDRACSSAMRSAASSSS